MRIREGIYGYDLEQRVDPMTQLRSNWKYTIYRLQPFEKVESTGEARTREEAESKAKAEIEKLTGKDHRRPAA